jgi:O-methyltransferase involved in polyketide biosynthesis
MVPVEKVSLTGVSETTLATLYARALDSRAAAPVLHDRFAATAVDRIDYDFAATGVVGPVATAIAARARALDDWTAAFLAAHPVATVLHLACGLDTRAHRLAAADTVHWVDVDLPAVLDLRARVLPDAPGDHRTVAASVLDDSWLDDVPDDRPTAVVFEGLSMYLAPAAGRRLVERTTARLPCGELLFDCVGTPALWLHGVVPFLRRAGATLRWAVDDPRAVQRWVPGLELLEVVRTVDLPGVLGDGTAARLAATLFGLLPVARGAHRLLRYRVAGQCAAVHGGGEGPRGEARQGPSRAL